MITSIRLNHFKRFGDFELPLGRLTLLTGANNTGKSSVIQALLLAHTDPLGDASVQLNGPFNLSLGRAGDVLNAEASNSEITIEIQTESGSGRVVLESPGLESPSLICLDRRLPEDLESAMADHHALEYVCAERLGPADLQDVAPEFDDWLSVGPRGEHTAHVLSQLARKQVDPARLQRDASSNETILTLTAQTERWMSSIVSPLQLDAQRVPGTNAAMIRFRSPEAFTDWLRPSNVGFGITQALPIVVAGLTLPVGGLLVVENPESHLHPGGQSEMGRFLGQVAASGVQVVVETHSDHLLNGIRVAIAADGLLPPADAEIHFFSSDGTVASVQLDGDGALSDWPPGFFDQSQRDLTALARAQRQH